VAGHEGHGAGNAAVGEGDARRGRRREPGGHARHHAPGDAGLGQRRRFLAAAAEHEGVAALQPHHPQPGAGAGDQPNVDRGLRQRRDTFPFAYRHDLGAGPHQPQHGPPRESIVQHEVGTPQRLRGAQGEQARVAGPGATNHTSPGRGPSPDARAELYSTTLIRSSREIRLTESRFRLSQSTSVFLENG
jgi:hypothetical protein